MAHGRELRIILLFVLRLHDRQTLDEMTQKTKDNNEKAPIDDLEVVGIKDQLQINQLLSERAGGRYDSPRCQRDPITATLLAASGKYRRSIDQSSAGVQDQDRERRADSLVGEGSLGGDSLATLVSRSNLHQEGPEEYEREGKRGISPVNHGFNAPAVSYQAERRSVACFEDAIHCGQRRGPEVVCSFVS